MDFSQLNTFVKIVQTGSFTRAAELLDTQKTYVSRVINQLEQQQGVRLLDRTTRSLSLTEAGKVLYERAVRILEAVQEAELSLQQQKHHPQGTLKITSGVEFGMIAVSGWINRYLKQYPEVNMEADFTHRVIDIVHEGFDLAIRLGELKDSSLVARKLGELHYHIYAHPDWVRDHPPIEHPNQLNGQSLCVFTGGSAKLLWRFEHPTQGKINLTLTNPRLWMNNTFAVRDAIIEQLGIGMLPTVVAEPEVKQGRLTPILTDWRLPSIPIHAVLPSNRYLTPKVRAFIDLAHQSLNPSTSPK